MIRWHDFQWRRVLQFWTALATAGQTSIRNHVFHDSLALAAGGCNCNWEAQVPACLQQDYVHVPVANREPVPVGAFQLQQAVAHQRQEHMPGSLSQRKALHIPLMVFAALMQSISSFQWDSHSVPTNNSKLHRILRFRMGAHYLPIEVGRHLRLS